MLVRRRFHPCGAIVIAIVLASVVHTANAQGTVQGPRFPGTVVSTAGPFVKPWTSPGNASASDDVDATATVTAPLQQTDFLDATNFGFSFAGDRVIRRILVEVEGRATASISTVRVQLLKGGVPVGSSMSTFYPNTATDGTRVFNDQDDVPFSVPLTLWGTTWTPAQINAANFGVRMDFQSISGSPATFEVDNVRVTVFSFPTLPTAQTWGLMATAGTLLLGAFVQLRRRGLTA